MLVFIKLIEAVNAHLKQNYRTRKVNNDFYIMVNGNWCNIGFQKSVSSTKNTVKFTINIGVNHSAHNDYLGLSTKESPAKFSYLVGGRVGNFLPVKTDYWWTIHETDNPSAIITTIIDIIDEIIIPFFNQYSQEKFVLEHINSYDHLRLSPPNNFILHYALLKKHTDEPLDGIIEEFRQFTIEKDMGHWFEEFQERARLKT